MRLRLHAVALAVLLLWPATIAWSQTTRPDERAVPSSQPDVAEMPPAKAPPAVSGVGPAAPAAPAPSNEMRIEPAVPPETATQESPAVAAPPPEDIMSNLLPGESSVAPAGGAPRAGDVVGGLGVDRDTRVLRPTPPERESAALPVDSLREAKSRLLPDGFIVPDRVGHVVRERGRWLFVFESDKSGQPDAPLILMPNSLLEAMLNQSNFGRANVKFRITGEVTQFQQTNYLLLRKVLIEHNMDRFVN